MAFDAFLLSVKTSCDSVSNDDVHISFILIAQNV